jgi:hypothetical protein
MDRNSSLAKDHTIASVMQISSTPGLRTMSRRVISLMTTATPASVVNDTTAPTTAAPDVCPLSMIENCSGRIMPAVELASRAESAKKIHQQKCVKYLLSPRTFLADQYIHKYSRVRDRVPWSVLIRLGRVSIKPWIPPFQSR